MEDCYIKEEDAEKEALTYFSNNYGWNLKPHPEGRNGVDIGGTTQDGKNVFIEVKWTWDKNGAPFNQESNQNKIHMFYGFSQLIARVTTENDIAILFLPYHRFFHSRLNKIEYTFKKLNFRLYFLYKDGSIKEYWAST